ncbi:MAG TPA: CopD family protein [Candidatus Eremiobacteraceae bacterium]|nr:CopD family protein [Candidatus Eremiobacteraceae bacterium]
MVQLLGIFGFLVVLLRAAILCLQTLTVGGIVFLTVVTRTAELRSEEMLRASWKLIRRCALALAFSQLFFVIANSMVLTYSTDIPWRIVLSANFLWAGVLAIVAALAIALWPVTLRRNVSPLVFLPGAMILAASVMTSHSASRMDHRAMLVGLTALHYLATASWIGGLPYLLIAAKRATVPPARNQIAQNFSRVAQINVATLILAGILMSWVYVGSWDAMYGTAYGVMLGAKIVLLGVLLLLGAANYYIVRDLQTDSGIGARSLLRFAEVEIGIGLTVILVAASMTAQPPGVDLTEDRVTLHDIAERFGPRMPRFSSPAVTQISPSTEQMVKDMAAAGKKLPASFVPGDLGFNTDTPADIAWSEYNHNCAGLVVFLMGILALLSRSRYFSWAKIWPLTFLLLAVFLFFRADPENWPMGPNGFWESFAQTDVLQHRLAVLLIILFAIFQYRVETNRLKSMAAALIFPAVCALGGVVLLTHTHAVTNVKEELLAELSHTPLALFGIMAGWSRWLELRLPQENPTRKYLAWVWPVCFIMVGLILMDYHES